MSRLGQNVEAVLTTDTATTQNPNSHSHIADKVDDIEFIHIDSRAPSSRVGIVAKAIPQENDFINPHPNHDYYSDRFSFPILVYATLSGTAATSCLLLVALRIQDVRPSDIIQSGSAMSFRFSFVPPLPILVGYLGFCVLLSLVFEIKRPKSRIYRRWCRFMLFCFFVGIFIMPSFGTTFIFFASMICAGIYAVMATVHIVRRYKSKMRLQKQNTSCGIID
jgi:hypothetical protein